ncbi:MAG TPA: FGGY-family carbohydrate kinase [Syntrophomonadaceae bacterium]|nr:FGGY-family carbohydrate kinase [Syntrophomonadaceae bacterium]HNX29444.1 FGGY-family carbohydrate kinase [Syntrophomonadaceae bacterium]HPR93820.1 FGGY-family carbohydrate kinase [Syntrophomonadaceae bacterium]
MQINARIITYDIGTTAVKTCLFIIDKEIRLIGDAAREYPLKILTNGGAEQNPDDWWEAMCFTTRQVLENAGVSPEQIDGISFCSQMQGLVLVDAHGNPLRPAMSYMDQRAGKQLQEGMAHGLQVAGCNVFKLLKSLYFTKAVAASVKDPVWKYRWVRDNEPELFSRIYKWLDVKEYLIYKCTGQFVMTTDSAYATLLYDTRRGHEGFSKTMCKMLGVEYRHLPRVIRSTENAGGLTESAAKMMGLKQGTPVFGGGGDASLIGIGSGAVKKGSTHIYFGTSGWVSTVVTRQLVDTSAMIASVVGADTGSYNYFAELETAGKCLEWVKDHLALDEIGIYLEKRQISDSPEEVFASLYDYMMHVVDQVPAGSRGVIFTPWLHGNRCPFEDPNARGMFFNISLDIGKSAMIRAVLEGVCYHLRWMLEAQKKKTAISQKVRFVGGGALSSTTCQILADILGVVIETVAAPQNVGAVGAAVVSAVGLGYLKSLDQAETLIHVNKSFSPDENNKKTYDKCFEVYKQLYVSNKHNFAALNGNLK